MFPQFSPYDLPRLKALDAVDWPGAGLDLVFCALPHATTQQVIKRIFAEVPSTRVVDLSADFRLADVAAYARWYGHEHHAPGAAGAGGLWPGRGLPARDQAGASGRQSRLLHDLRAAAARAAAQGQGDRSGRDRHRCEVGHDRRRPRRQGGDDLLRGVGGLPRLRRRPPSPHGRARPGILQGRGTRRDGDVHAAPRADEPRHPVDHLRARTARAERRRPPRDRRQGLRQGSRSCTCCRSARRRRRATCAAPT